MGGDTRQTWRVSGEAIGPAEGAQILPISTDLIEHSCVRGPPHCKVVVIISYRCYWPLIHEIGEAWVAVGPENLVASLPTLMLLITHPRNLPGHAEILLWLAWDT